MYAYLCMMVCEMYMGHDRGLGVVIGVHRQALALCVTHSLFMETDSKCHMGKIDFSYTVSTMLMVKGVSNICLWCLVQTKHKNGVEKGVRVGTG